jgi:hypothetical protein
MATLIPALNSCKRRMTPGERRFGERLEAKLEPEFLIWYEVPVGRKAHHPDFVVFHPHVGVLTLEVKDWRTTTIHTINSSQAVLLTHTGLKHVLNPYEQARRIAEQLTDELQRDPLLVVPEPGRYGGRLCFPWTFGVVLPFITRKQFNDHDLGQVLPEHRVICADEMLEGVDADAFRERLTRMVPWTLRAPLSSQQVERVRWHVFPEVRVAPARQGALLTDVAPDIVRVMDIEQERLARSLGEGHRVIHGVAGSGKTMILVYRCVHLARMVRKPVLVTCYNKTLAERLAELLHEQGVGEHVHVRHFHAWCRDQLVRYGCDLPAAGSSGEYAKELVERFAAAAATGRIPSQQYGAVLIDEGHDFEPEWLKLVVEMVDPETDSLLLLYDDAQSIYRLRGGISLKSLGIRAQGRTTILRLNYRNTAEVLGVAHKFAEDLLKPEDADDDGIPLVAPMAADRHGPLPELARFSSLTDEAIHLARTFASLNAEGYSWADMAVVYRDRFVEDAVRVEFERANIPVETLTKRSRHRPQGRENKVGFVTFQSSKGLEYPVVAIPGLGRLPDAREPEVNQVRLAYVAMTRATERLILTCHRESGFVQRLVAAGAMCA